MALFAAGCAQATPWRLGRTEFRSIPPSLCISGASVVTSKDSEILQRVFARIYAVAQADLGRLIVSAVVVRIPAAPGVSEDDGMAVCRATDRATITLSETRLARVLRRPSGELAIARGVAHLLGLLAGHPPATTRITAADRDEISQKADEVGVYYFERAGYDCSRWETPGQYLRHVRIACNLAKQGIRVRLPPALSSE